MNKINWKLRFSNPVFIAQIGMSMLMPIMGYLGIEVGDITSWKVLGDVLLESIKNPYVLGMVVVSLYNAIYEPTSAGLISDSQETLEKKSLK